MARLLILSGALLCWLVASTGWAALLLDFRDPVPTGPSDDTAGETLETGATFSVGLFDVDATPAGTLLMGDGLLANADSFGVNSDNFGTFTDIPEHIQFDGAEELTILFNKSVLISLIDLQGLVGSETANITAGSFTIDLFTGVDDFNGSTDKYTPANPFLVTAGTGIVFSGTTAGASFGLQGIEVTIIPEPSSLTLAVIGLAGLASLGWRRRRFRVA